jgi:hypothetical protein
VHEASHGDGIQVGDFCFAPSSLADLRQLRLPYPNVQGYAAQQFQHWLKVAEGSLPR